MSNDTVERGVTSHLTQMLGFKVGDKCLVVFKPNFVHNPEDGIVVDCCIEVVEQTIKTSMNKKESSTKYIISFGLESTTVNDDVLFKLEQKQQANTLAELFLTQSIDPAKNRIKKLENALALTKT